MSLTSPTTTDGPRRWSHYFWLPGEPTAAERGHLAAVNRAATRFYIAHVPVFAVIGYLNGTGAVTALLLTCFFALAPLFASVIFDNPRHVSIVHGATAMCMGAVLVHLGQGPMQIEMHFYFFCLIAILAGFANPLVIWAAAATVTAHHLVFWMVLPSSVFNYDAGFGVVLVHAAFVLVESVVASYIARNLFDRVIGLELIVQSRTAALQKRTRDMRLILENVSDGLVIIDLDGQIGREHAQILDEWFGRPEPRMRFSDWIRPIDGRAATWFDLGLELVTDGVMPIEVTLSQMPTEMTLGTRTLGLAYEPIVDDANALQQIVVVVSDITAEKEAAAETARRHEITHLFERLVADRAGFLEFFAEADEIVQGLADQRFMDLETCKRWLHTLKGNSMLFGLEVVAQHCQQLEAFAIEENLAPDTATLQGLVGRWAELKSDLDHMLGQFRSSRVEIDERTYQTILRAVLDGRPRAELAEMIREWKMESTEVRLTRVAENASAIAQRIGKDHVVIETRAGGLHLDPDRWSPFWQAFVHVVRNALDHGIETPEERQLAGKPEKATLLVETRMEPQRFVIQITDDGRGIDYDKVRSKAREEGLPIHDESQMTAILFRDGFTTRDYATDFSGRGIGMGAVRQATEALGGHVEIRSVAGRGTTVRFVFPLNAMRARERAVA